MSHKQYLIFQARRQTFLTKHVRSISLFLTCFTVSALAQAQSIQLTPQQIKALGVEFYKPVASEQSTMQLPARVVPSLGAQTVVSLPYAGMVTRVAVNTGDTVRAGQVLLTMMSPQWLEAQRSASEAQSQAQLAKQSLVRDEALYKEGIIPAARLQATRAKVHELQLLQNARQTEIKGTRLRATGSGEAQLLASQAGTVTQLHIVPGQRVDAATALMRITQITQLELDIQLTQGSFPLGSRVEVPSHAAIGQITAIVPSGDGVASPRARASLQTKGRLQNGDLVTAQISLPKTILHNGPSTIPARAMLFYKGQEGVLTSIDGERIQFAPIKVAQYGNTHITLTQPLPKNVRVVSSGMVALKAMLLEDTPQATGEKR